MASSSTSDYWTRKQNKRFENALAMYEEESPDRWKKLARAVGGGKTEEEVKRHYEKLVHDLRQIEEGQVPLPNYIMPTYIPFNCIMDEHQRMEALKLK
ncbi:hypothetical protein K1719_015639 [Acacia pycnantha]|nr:hypothetical protein K1719_015639 [Acacia pycnantha]